MIKLDSSDTIKAPVDRVFAYVTDFRTAAEWQDGVIESTQTPDAPTQVGTKVKMIRLLMGQRVDGTGEVTEFVPNQKFAFKTVSGPVKLLLQQTFSSADGGTKVDTHMEMETGGVLKIAEPMVAGNMKQQMQDQAKKLKQILES